MVGVVGVTVEVDVAEALEAVESVVREGAVEGFGGRSSAKTRVGLGARLSQGKIGGGR